MTPEQQAAFVASQTACALIEMEAMKAANVAFDARNRGPWDKAMPRHTETDFKALIDKYGIHHNAVITVYQS